MAVDFEKFRGTLHYASELFGVFQPLIGWRSDLIKLRLALEQSKTTNALVNAMAKDSRFRRAIGADRSPKGPDANLPPKPPAWLNKAISAQFRAGVTDFQRVNRRSPRGEEWEDVIGNLQLEDTVKAAAASLTASGRLVEGLDVIVVNRKTLTADQLSALGAVNIQGTDLALARASKPMMKKSKQTPASSLAVSTAIQAGTLGYLAKKAPSVLNALTLSKAVWELLLAWVDPLSQFDPETQDAVLSPIGLMQIYRQFFFEFDSFLGPPVGHVWVSPGGSLELFEIHTRKTLEQKTVEMRTQTTTRSEKTMALEDELASKVGKENSSSVSLGVSVSAGVDFGVFQADAETKFGFNSAQKSSQAVAHSHSRKQTEKISNEMRRDFKTIFRTSVETQDTSSRRYVLQNTTDKLVNYEFRRKMRQVGVQLQHIATQLCWQTYVDNPGFSLAISELVHIAKRGDLTGQLQPPDAPPLLDPIEKDFEAVFPFLGDEDEMDETYTLGKEGTPDVLFFDFDEDSIQAVKQFTTTLPATGYRLDNVHQRDVQGTAPEEDPPSPVAAEFEVIDATTFQIRLTQVNFQDNPALRFFLTLTFVPSEATLKTIQDAYNGKVAEYEQAKSRAAHEEYVRAVRERIKLASNIEKRPSSELRSEERTAVFEHLIKQLRPGAADELPHVTVELIRAIFDVERMLYFVSESWWMPRIHYRQQFYAGTKEALSSQDSVGWGGPGGLMRRWLGIDNYYITEDSQPAPTGASLGWLLQLDGDAHRNAFLNSPFVKAVIPIRPGKELAAIEWLERAEVEGADGLDTPYHGTEPEFQDNTIRQVLKILAARLRSENTNTTNVLATESVFETGFDPLEGGFVADGEPYKVFDQWIEVLPTEQLVAVEYPPPTQT